MKPLIPVFLYLALAFSCSAGFAQTILLVRHAEKVSEAADALLSDIGKQRAEKVARTLADAGITAIFTTEAERTKQTAAPLAKVLHLQPVVVPAKDVAGLVNKLAAQPQDAVVLVVGHSNTLPAIIEKLLNSSAPRVTMQDVDYDKLFVIGLNPHKNFGAAGEAPPKLLILHY